MQGMLLIIVELIELIIILLFIVISVASMIKGAVFLPTSTKRVNKMVDLAKITPGMIVADLGSGDGRIVIAMAEKGAIAHGFEINPFLVLFSRIKIRRNNLQYKAFIHWKSFWSQNFSSYQVVMIFGISYIMKDLEKKLKKELPINAKVVSNGFQFPSWKPFLVKESIYIYRKSKDIKTESPLIT